MKVANRLSFLTRTWLKKEPNFILSFKNGPILFFYYLFIYFVREECKGQWNLFMLEKTSHMLGFMFNINKNVFTSNIVSHYINLLGYNESFRTFYFLHQRSDISSYDVIVYGMPPLPSNLLSNLRYYYCHSLFDSPSCDIDYCLIMNPSSIYHNKEQEI